MEFQRVAASQDQEEVSGAVLMRVADWDQRLMAVIEAHESRAYQAGTSDCFTMAMECIGAVTGVRPYEDVRYKTDAKGLAVMRKRGFSDLSEALAVILPDRERGNVMRGDIAVMDGTAGPTLGVVVNGGIAWKSDRVRMIPMTEARRFFAVG